MNGVADKGRVLVIGVGNTLRGDDGIGVAVARALADQSLAPDTRVLDGGTDGLNLLLEIQEAARVILIDAAEMGKPAGEVRVLDGALLNKTAGLRFSSTHAFSIPEVLALGRSIGVEPEVTVVAIQPENTGPQEGLSERLEGRLPDYIELTKALLAPEQVVTADRVCGQRE